MWEMSNRTVKTNNNSNGPFAIYNTGNMERSMSFIASKTQTIKEIKVNEIQREITSKR